MVSNTNVNILAFAIPKSRSNAVGSCGPIDITFSRVLYKNRHSLGTPANAQQTGGGYAGARIYRMDNAVEEVKKRWILG